MEIKIVIKKSANFFKNDQIIIHVLIHALTTTGLTNTS